MTLSRYNNAFNTDGSAIGKGLSAIGGPLFVVNTSSQHLNTPVAGDAIDPWALAAGSPSFWAVNHGNVRPVLVPEFGMYLNLWHVWRGNLTSSVAPRIQVAGRMPRPQSSPPEANRLPYKDDAEFPDVGRNFWTLLEDPDEANEYLEFGTADAVRYRDKMWISKKRTVYLQGAKELLVGVIRVAQFLPISGASSSSSGSDMTHGLIVGQISG